MRARSVYPGLLFLAALDAAGYSVIAPVVPAISRATGAGPGVLGVLVGTFAVGMALGFALAGQGVQRRRASSVLAAALVLVALGAVGFVALSGLAAYFVARLLMGIGSGGLWIGITFAVLERYPGQEYQRLTGVLAAYSVGGIGGAALGAAGGIRAPFAAYLGLTVVAGAAVALLGAPRRPARFASDRTALRSPGFRLAAAGILLVSLAFGVLDGPLPLHFSVLLSQAEIAALYVATSIVIGLAATAAGRIAPRPALLGGTVLLVAGTGLAGLGVSVSVWLVALAALGVGIGIAEAGALGVLLDTVGTERIVLAMVVWSQVWAVGYLAGPAVAGGVAEALGFAALGLVPLVAAVLVLAAFVRAPAPGRAAAGLTSPRTK